MQISGAGGRGALQRLYSGLANRLGRTPRRVLNESFMGHNKGKDNVKKRAVRRKKNDRLQAAKDAAKSATVS